MKQEYKGLSYRLLGNPNPHGRSRIFFLSCKEDREQYFEEVCADIFESQGSAVIWYASEESGDLDCPEYYRDLQEMNLFVVVVTEKFLKAVAAGEMMEFFLAKKNRIPILPLVQDPSLLQNFNRLCGEYQTLCKNAPFDPTAIPYKEKLREFLETTLFPENLMGEIRNAFDAYIFLSYRKKDRFYAQDVMRKIHASDRLRRLAIWYDEYLVPGENFNESIEAALHKSELFVLVVTPNIVNEENYVKNVEYPRAVELSKKIIPVEEVATDREKLTAQYPSIPSVKPAEEATELTEYLSDLASELSKGEPMDDARRAYLLGLSYQLGIDVEKDPDYALKMFDLAMQGGSEEAYRHVVSMYWNGHFVEKDLNKAQNLQLQLIHLLEERLSALEKSGEDFEYLRTLQHLFSCYFTLENIERNLGIAPSDSKHLDRMIAISEEINRYIEERVPENPDIKFFFEPLNDRNRIRCLLLKRKVAQAAEAAESYYEFMKDMLEDAPEVLLGTKRKDLERAFDEAKLLYIGTKAIVVSSVIASKQLSKAREMYDAFCEFVDANYPENCSVAIRMVLASLYNAMGDFENESGNPTRAYNAYSDSETLLAEINAEQPGLDSLRYHFFVCKNLCTFLIECEGDWVKARGLELAVKAAETMEKVLLLKRTNQYLWDCGLAYTFAGAFSKLQKDFDASDAYLEKAEVRISDSGEDSTFISDFMDEFAPDDFDDFYTAPKR